MKLNKLNKFTLVKFGRWLVVVAQRGFIGTVPYKVVGWTRCIWQMLYADCATELVQLCWCGVVLYTHFSFKWLWLKHTGSNKACNSSTTGCGGCASPPHCKWSPHVNLHSSRHCSVLQYAPLCMSNWLRCQVGCLRSHLLSSQGPLLSSVSAKNSDWGPFESQNQFLRPTLEILVSTTIHILCNSSHL